MAQKRMFSLQIVDTDAFLDMPQSSQLLYFHLSMRADDEGFVSSPKKIMKMVGSSDDDYKILCVKKFVIPFESGICVIKHWLIHNIIRMDRFGETAYKEEKGHLMIKENRAYSLIPNGNQSATKWQPNGNQMAPQVKLSKGKLSKYNLESSANAPTPAEEMREFINSEEKQQSIVIFLESKGVNKDLAINELKKFLSYWTEPNKSGTRQRWETERTFEIKRRLTTWFSRVNNFSQANKSKFTSI